MNTDYLVVGAGASGLAFADTLVAEANVEVTVIDRRGAAGGHWLQAYPFVRLHSPSAYYGVNSLALGEDRIDELGENVGYYERATGGEVCEYFAEAAARLRQTGRVRILTGHERLGRGTNGEQVRDLNTGELHDIAVRRRVVDARYLEASVPATHATPFEVASGRIDPSSPATMYRGTMLSARELDALRQIEDVVRLGRVRRIEADRIVLEHGETETRPDVLHVDCTALGLRNAPATPIFQPGRIVLQQVRHNSPPFNAALLGFVEAHRDDDADKNRLCPPNPYASSIEDWPRMMSRTWRTEKRWLNEPDLSAWVVESRLNLLRALPDHAADPSVQAAIKRYLSHVGAAIQRLKQLDGSRSPGATRDPLP